MITQIVQKIKILATLINTILPINELKTYVHQSLNKINYFSDDLSLQQKHIVSHEYIVSLPELGEALLHPPVLRYSGYRHSLASPGTEEAWTSSLAESENEEHETVSVIHYFQIQKYTSYLFFYA